MIELNIKIKEWDCTCGDGCCYTWGKDVFINDEKVSSGDYDDITIILKDVLGNLGYKVNIE
jgi:hypothetical protein